MVWEICSENLRRGNELIYPHGVDNFMMDIGNEARGSDMILSIASYCSIHIVHANRKVSFTYNKPKAK